MKIAITGIRGIPANYGGFETFAEELATRLVKRGHEVTVYGRKNNVTISGRFYKGVRLVILPTIKHKYLDTVAHTFISVLHILGQKYDLVLICNAANSIFSWIPRLSGKKVLVNVDGIERKRKKWNKLGKAYYHISEWLSTFLPDGIVTDAKAIQDYYWNRYGKPSCMIAYGASTSRKTSPHKIRKFGLEPEKYVLYVSRLEPENNAHLVIQAFEQVKTDFRLAIVGDAPYAQEYKRKLKNTKDPRILFLGFVFGDGYKTLQQNAYCYVQATEVGGTHPALVEAMGYGNCVLFLNTPEHREVTGDCAIPFSSVNELKDKLQMVLLNTALVEDYRKKAMLRIKSQYGWEGVTDSYEELFASMLNGIDLKNDFKQRRMQCVILAGGLATRMRPMTSDIPKSMIKIEGKPFLEYQLNLLRENDVRDIVLCIGHLGWRIKDYFGKGDKLGMNIQYSDEGQNLLGTGGALKKAENLLDDKFFVLYGDSYLPIDFGAVNCHFDKFQKKSLMIVYENADMYDKSNVEIEQGLVKSYDKKNNRGMLYIDAGVSILKKDVLELIPSNCSYPLERVYHYLIKEKEMLAYQTKQRFYQIGSFEGLEEVKKLVRVFEKSESGKISVGA